MDKTPEQTTTELMESVKQAYNQDLINSLNSQRKLYEDANSIMYNLVLFAGAFSTGALVLLGSDFPTNRPFILSGVIILLILILGVFFYLFHYHGKATDDFKKFTKRKITPGAKLLLSYINWKEGKINYKEFDQILLKEALESRERDKVDYEFISNEKVQNNYYDLIFVAVLSTGIIFIIYGLLFQVI